MSSLHLLLVAASLLVCVSVVSFRNPFLVKNLFVVYTIAIYIIAPLVLAPDRAEIYAWLPEFVIVLLLFDIGYETSLKWARRKAHPVDSVKQCGENGGRVVRFALLILMLSNAAVLLVEIVSFGVPDFYGGRHLAASIQQYADLNVAGAARRGLGFLLAITTSAMLSVFVERAASERMGTPAENRLQARGRLALRYSLVWFLLFPLLELSRAAFVFGSISYLAVRRVLVGGAVKLRIVLLLAITVSFFVYVGLARAEWLGERIQVRSVFASELTPWIAYREIKGNIDQLGYQYGGTLFPPLLLKIIPRGVFSDKPYNSSALLMSTLYPGYSSVGLSWAPTYMGDLYLNFGLPGVLLGTFLLGMFSGRIDAIVLYRQLQRFGLFLLVFSNYLLLLRNNLSDSLFVLVTGMALYLAVSQRVRVVRRQD